MPVSLAWLNPSHPKSLYSHELHLQYNEDQRNIWLDAAKLKKESEKAKKALCKKNEKKRKAEAIGGHSEITTAVATRMNFLQYLSHKVHPNLIKMILLRSNQIQQVEFIFDFFMKWVVLSRKMENGSVFDRIRACPKSTLSSSSIEKGPYFLWESFLIMANRFLYHLESSLVGFGSWLMSSSR